MGARRRRCIYSRYLRSRASRSRRESRPGPGSHPHPRIPSPSPALGPVHPAPGGFTFPSVPSQPLRAGAQRCKGFFCLFFCLFFLPDTGSAVMLQGWRRCPGTSRCARGIILGTARAAAFCGCSAPGDQSPAHSQPSAEQAPRGFLSRAAALCLHKLPLAFVMQLAALLKSAAFLPSFGKPARCFWVYYVFAYTALHL